MGDIIEFPLEHPNQRLIAEYEDKLGTLEYMAKSDLGLTEEELEQDQAYQNLAADIRHAIKMLRTMQTLPLDLSIQSINERLVDWVETRTERQASPDFEI